MPINGYRGVAAGGQRATRGLHPVVGGLWLAARGPVQQAYISADPKPVLPNSIR